MFVHVWQRSGKIHLMHSLQWKEAELPHLLVLPGHVPAFPHDLTSRPAFSIDNFN
jgi:hypothetical protein